VREGMHGFDAMLLAYSDSPSEWQALRQMPISEAATWIATQRVTPS